MQCVLRVERWQVGAKHSRGGWKGEGVKTTEKNIDPVGRHQNLMEKIAPNNQSSVVSPPIGKEHEDWIPKNYSATNSGFTLGWAVDLSKVSMAHFVQILNWLVWLELFSLFLYYVYAKMGVA
jgi:hypothetical protein